MARFSHDTVQAVIHLLTTEMDSLANNTGTAVGPEIDNSSGFMVGQLTLHLGSAAFTATSYVTVLFVPSTDLAGGAYPTTTAGASVPLQNYQAENIYIYPSTAAHDEMKQEVRIPVGKFKTILVNRTGVTLASSGNTLDLYPTPVKAV